MSDKNYRVLYEEALAQLTKTDNALYVMTEELAKERRTGGICNVCAGSGLLLDGETCAICSGTGYGYKETEWLRELAIGQQNTITKLLADHKRVTAALSGRVLSPRPVAADSRSSIGRRNDPREFPEDRSGCSNKVDSRSDAI